MKFFTFTAGAALALACSLPALAETAITIKETELKKDATMDSATIATLPGKSQVEVLKRQGGWTQVKPAAEPQGWVKMFNLKYGDGSAKSEGGGGLGSLFNVARTGSSGTTVTTGVKGLDITKDTLQNANPNPNELKHMHSFTVSKAEALKLASSANLRKQSVDYAEAGSSRSSGSSSSGGSSSSSWGDN